MESVWQTGRVEKWALCDMFHKTVTLDPFLGTWMIGTADTTGLYLGALKGHRKPYQEGTVQ